MTKEYLPKYRKADEEPQTPQSDREIEIMGEEYAPSFETQKDKRIPRAIKD